MVAVIALLAIFVLLGFAAEPSTSTEFDVREGRGVAAIQARNVDWDGASTSAPSPMRIQWTFVGALGLLTLVLGATAPISGLAPDDARMPRSARGNCALWRGPPAV